MWKACPARSSMTRPSSKGSGRGAGQDETDVLDGAASRTDGWSDVLRPLPAGLVRRAADRQCRRHESSSNLPLTSTRVSSGVLEAFESDPIHTYLVRSQRLFVRSAFRYFGSNS